MALKLKTSPSIAPVSIQEAKQHCRIDTDDEDALIEMYISAATAHLDGYSGILGRCLISQVWELYYDAFPSEALEIPLGPVTSIGSVEYVDPDTGGYVTWPQVNNYEIDLASLNAWVIPVDSWPAIMDTSNAVRVTFTAGFGAAAASVPAPIRAAILLMVGDLYDNRSAKLDGQMLENPTVRRLVYPYRRVPV